MTSSPPKKQPAPLRVVATNVGGASAWTDESDTNKQNLSNLITLLNRPHVIVLTETKYTVRDDLPQRNENNCYLELERKSAAEQLGYACIHHGPKHSQLVERARVAQISNSNGDNRIQREIFDERNANEHALRYAHGGVSVLVRNDVKFEEIRRDIEGYEITVKLTLYEKETFIVHAVYGMTGSERRDQWKRLYKRTKNQSEDNTTDSPDLIIGDTNCALERYDRVKIVDEDVRVSKSSARRKEEKYYRRIVDQLPFVDAWLETHRKCEREFTRERTYMKKKTNKQVIERSRIDNALIKQERIHDVRSCEIHKENQFSSDHFPLLLTLNSPCVLEQNDETNDEQLPARPKRENRCEKTQTRTRGYHKHRALQTNS